MDGDHAVREPPSDPYTYPVISLMNDDDRHCLRDGPDSREVLWRRVVAPFSDARPYHSELADQDPAVRAIAMRRYILMLVDYILEIITYRRRPISNSLAEHFLKPRIYAELVYECKELLPSLRGILYCEPGTPRHDRAIVIFTSWLRLPTSCLRSLFQFQSNLGLSHSCHVHLKLAEDFLRENRIGGVPGTIDDLALAIVGKRPYSDFASPSISESSRTEALRGIDRTSPLWSVSLKWLTSPTRRFLSPVGRSEYVSLCDGRNWHCGVDLPGPHTRTVWRQSAPGVWQMLRVLSEFVSVALDESSHVGGFLRRVAEADVLSELLKQMQSLQALLSILLSSGDPDCGHLRDALAELCAWLRQPQSQSSESSAVLRDYLDWCNDAGLTLVLDVDSEILLAFLDHGNLGHACKQSCSVSDYELRHTLRCVSSFVPPKGVKRIFEEELNFD